MALFNTGYKEYSKRVDYSAISNLEDLRAARKNLEHKIINKETELNYQFKEIKELLNPATYINRLVMQFSSVEHIVRCFCRGFRVAREIIKEYNHR